MTNFMENPTKVGGSTSDGISPGRGKVKIRLALQDGTEGLVLTLTNVFYLPYSPSNLISLGLSNDAGIFHHNEDQTLYDLETRKTLAFAERYKTSFLLHPLNLSVAAVSLLRNNDVYEEPNVHQTQDKKLPLTRWHQRLGHLNFAALKRHLAHHNIAYTDDAEGYVCDSYERTKATKRYNRTLQQRATKPYQFIHTDLVGPITPIGFGGERYFFTFTDDYTRITETYTAKQKSEWLKCLKAFYNLARTRTKLDRPTERLRSDYGFELQSLKVDKWLINRGIIFEPSAPYSQEENGVSERSGRTIIEMVRATILEGDMDDTLWPEVVLAMTHVKNLRPTRALEGAISPLEKQENTQPSFQHLRVLGSTVYVFLQEEERTLKSAKWDARALKGKLVGFDGHTIYRVHIEEQGKVIRVKDLRIYEDTSAKQHSTLPDFDGKPTFDGIQQTDEEEHPSSRAVSSDDGNRDRERHRRSSPPPSKRQKLMPPKDKEKTSTAKPRQTRAGRTVKPTPKATTSTPPDPNDTDALITLLAKLLNDDWEQEEKISAFLTSIDDDAPDTSLDPLHILATSLQKVNSTDPGDFVFSTQLDVEEPETYERAMSCSHAQQWAHAIQEEIDQLEKNKTWDLVPMSEVKAGHKPLSGKWVFKVKRDVNGDIARFKARWVV